MACERWARLRYDLDRGIRRGAWYRVLGTELNFVDLAVHGQKTTLTREELQFVTNRPPQWTLIVHDARSLTLPGKLGKRYAVCPSCCFRQVPTGQPKALRCDKCNNLFEIAWREPFNVGKPHGRCC